MTDWAKYRTLIESRQPDLFDDMPYLVVAVTPENARKIEEGEDGIGILHLAAYPNPPGEVELSNLDRELREDEEFNWIGTDFQLYIPEGKVRENMIETFREKFRENPDLEIRLDRES